MSVIKAAHTVTFYGERGMQTFSLNWFERNSERITLHGQCVHIPHPTVPCGARIRINTGWEGAQS